MTPGNRDQGPATREAAVVPRTGGVRAACPALAAISAWRGSATAGERAIAAAALLVLELLVQVPFVGPDVLQAVMAAVAVTIAILGRLTIREALRGSPRVPAGSSPSMAPPLVGEGEGPIGGGQMTFGPDAERRLLTGSQHGAHAKEPTTAEQ